jgi:dihydroxyacetone kinase-like predicted kinase
VAPAGIEAVPAPALAALVEEQPKLRPDQIGVVAVAAGDGLADIFRSLGVAAIIPGGQTHNPSTEEILQAIEQVETERVIILPNNKNIILAAEAALELCDRQVGIVATRTAPQGMSAMLAWNADGDLRETVQAMTRNSKQVRSGEITTATRTVTLDGVQVESGQIIGLADGKICAAGRDLGDVLTRTLGDMGVDEGEILSVYYGQDVTHEEAQALADQIAARYPDLEVELYNGGQPHFYYVLGLE